MTSATYGMRSSTWQGTARILAFELFLSQSSKMSATLTSLCMRVPIPPRQHSLPPPPTIDHVLMLSSSYPMCNISWSSPSTLRHVPILPSPFRSSHTTAKLSHLTTSTADLNCCDNRTWHHPRILLECDPCPQPCAAKHPTHLPHPCSRQHRRALSGACAFESATDSSTSLSTFPVAFPQPTTGASDRGATTDGVGNSAERNDNSTGPQSMDPPTNMTAPVARSPQPPPLLRSSADVAIAGPSLSSRDAEQWGNQPPR
jgi:hypothetical protein